MALESRPVFPAFLAPLCAGSCTHHLSLAMLWRFHIKLTTRLVDFPGCLRLFPHVLLLHLVLHHGF